ncbi:hypothetical protein [Pseudomonas sp. Irchel s3h17]|uniref:hypothetical protein n=1 Tax=Pseudomonas sp. Irchel s3h17 TaxID=2009182 RepID=UPI00155F0F78|nr:hypothetical protein [Pseudomonas sp. Irchel s3h17]
MNSAIVLGLLRNPAGASSLATGGHDEDYYASAHGSVDLITPGAPRPLELSTNYRF